MLFLDVILVAIALVKVAAALLARLFILSPLDQVSAAVAFRARERLLSEALVGFTKTSHVSASGLLV